MRVFGNLIWVAYSIELQAFLFILSNIISLTSSIFISYYKVIEIYEKRQEKTDTELYVAVNNDTEV